VEADLAVEHRLILMGATQAVPHRLQAERQTDITAALILWLEHASFHGAKSKAMIYSRSLHDQRNVRWLCECIMPIYGGTISDRRTVWTLPNGAALYLNAIEEDEMPAGHGGIPLTMLIVVKPQTWPEPILAALGGFLRNRYGIPSRYITTGDLT